MVYTLRVRERDKETKSSKGDQCVDQKKDNWMKKKSKHAGLADQVVLAEHFSRGSPR
jgi:hypothetical protein